MPEPEQSVTFIKPVGLPPLMVVSFGITAALESEFNQFYNQQFLPELFALSPQLRSIRRFAKLEVETSVATDVKEFLTFYELDSEETLDKTDAIFGHIQFAKTLGVFRQYKETALTNFSRINYLPIQRLQRAPEGAGLAAPAFSYCYLWHFELPGPRQEQFLDWYLGQYQQQVFLQAADLFACHTYKIYGAGPIRLLTVFETADAETLEKSLERLSKEHLGSENTTWQAFCRDGTVVGPAVDSVRSIFALP
jgi:hypothetical protein